MRPKHKYKLTRDKRIGNHRTVGYDLAGRRHAAVDAERDRRFGRQQRAWQHHAVRGVDVFVSVMMCLCM